MMKGTGRRAWLWAAVLVFAGIIAGLVVSSRMGLMNTGIADRQPGIRNSAVLNQLSEGFADVAGVAIPSVVNISTTKTVKQQNPFYPFFGDPFFRRFFGNPGQGGGGGEGPYQEYKEQSLGSGVIVSTDGYIVTNNHVVEGASEIKVTLSDNRNFKGKIVGTDPKSDVAVIKIDARGLPAITWADSDRLRPGEAVMAVGSPFGLSRTVTLGIISAVGRANVGISDYEDFIQTDAAINPGNSGGALVNLKGELVGINTAIFSRTGGYQGIGFAVPSNMVKRVMDSLIKTGKVIRGWLGVSVQDVTPQLARQFGVSGAGGALVAEVMKDSPAQKAGLKAGDVITAIDGKNVEDSGHLRNIVSGAPVGSKVRLDIIRDKKKMEVGVVIGELPSKTEEAKAGETTEKESVLAGVAVDNLTPDMMDKLGLEAGTKGVVVMSVDPGSAADEAGLARGDVIVSINNRRVGNTREYGRALSGLKKDEPVLLRINRQGEYIWMTVGSSD